MDTILVVLLVLSLLIFLFIYCPIVAFHLKKYHSRQTHLIYLLRYSNITIIQSILLIIKLIYDSFYTLAATYLFDYHSIQNKIVSTINAYLAAYLLYCFVWKFWLLRYNIILNDIAVNSNWKSIINPKEFKFINTTFYIKYRKTFGDSKFIMYLLFIIATILTSIYNITILFFPHIYTSASHNSYIVSLYSSWDYVIPYILLIIIYLTTPQFNDNFYITKEMKYIFICLSINYVSYFAHLLLFSLLFASGKLDQLTEDIGVIVVNNVIIFAQFWAIYTSTKWVNDRCDKIIATNRYRINRVPTKLELEVKHTIEITAKPKLQNKSNSDENLEELPTTSTMRTNVFESLLSGKIYYGFINHLSHEMCIECLLSLTEFVQYREFVKKTTNDYVVEETDLFSIKLPDKVPKSWIVMNSKWNKKQKAYELYIKYVAKMSDFEINLSSMQRNYYFKLMNNYQAFMENGDITDKHLIHLYDQCCEEMVRLMTDAMYRFQQTATYDKL